MDYTGDKVKVTSSYSIKTYRLVATKIYTRRTWFSDESFTLRAKPKGYKIEPTRKTGNEHEFYVVFPRKTTLLSKTLSFKTIFTGSNKKRRCESFYWFDALVPIEHLALDIRIPEKMCSESAVLKEFYANVDNANKELIEYDNGFFVDIKKPKVGYSYKLEWKWAGIEARLRK